MITIMSIISISIMLVRTRPSTATRQLHQPVAVLCSTLGRRNDCAHVAETVVSRRLCCYQGPEFHGHGQVWNLESEPQKCSRLDNRNATSFSNVKQPSIAAVRQQS